MAWSSSIRSTSENLRRKPSPEHNDAKVAEVLAASRETGMPVHGLVNILGNRKAHIASPDEATREKGRTPARTIGPELPRIWWKRRVC